MSHPASPSTLEEPVFDGAGPRAREYFALAVVHATAPELIGSVMVLRETVSMLGRGAPSSDDDLPRLIPMRQRPGKNEALGPISSNFISRMQLRVSAQRDAVVLENVGRCQLFAGCGTAVDRLELPLGGVVSLGRQLMLLLVRRPAVLPKLQHKNAPTTTFGVPDEAGLVGESPGIWELRDTIAFLAQRSAHVLVLGPSGSGKEVVAQAIHQQSLRGDRPFVARNAATIPTSLADAELFGCAANYPNAGMPERPGLVGEAHRSTLFLDEIGELPREVQTKLLRVLDGGGDYQRLGDARRRQSDLRLVGATNRTLETLRHDVAARFKLRVSLRGLEDRREDIPLLVRHLLNEIVVQDVVIGKRFCDADGTPRVTFPLMLALVRRAYTTHVRELEGLLWASIAESDGDELDLPDDATESTPSSAPAPRAPTPQLTADDIREALQRVGGSRERAWRELGLANRYVLKRLMQKFRMAEDGGSSDER